MWAGSVLDSLWCCLRGERHRRACGIVMKTSNVLRLGKLLGAIRFYFHGWLRLNLMMIYPINHRAGRIIALSMWLAILPRQVSAAPDQANTPPLEIVLAEA